MPDKSPSTFCIDLILVGDCYIEWQLSVVCPSDRWKQCLITSVATDEGYQAPSQEDYPNEENRSFFQQELNKEVDDIRKAVDSIVDISTFSQFTELYRPSEQVMYLRIKPSQVENNR